MTVVAVKAARTTIVQHVPTAAPTTGVKGAQHTIKTPTTKTAVAPLTATKRSGTLPFTGAQLTLFLLVGLGLVATGFVLRSTARGGSRNR